MLASTVQFSTTHQRPAPPPRRTHPRRGWWYEDRTGPDRDNAPARTAIRCPGGNPLPQDPTACLPPPARTRLRSPRPHRGAVLGAGHEPAAALVSVPPSSTTRTPRARPPTGQASWSGMALHRPDHAGRRVLLRKEVIQPHLPV